MQTLAGRLRTWLRGDLSIPATAVTLVALGCHYAGNLTAATLFGMAGAGLVFLKYRAKRRA